MTVPGGGHARHAFGVGECHDSVDQSMSQITTQATQPDDGHQFGERGVDVAEVLEDLHGDRAVDGRVADRELGRLALEQADIRPVAGLAGGDREHRRAGVHAGDRAVRADDVEEIDHVEPGPAADVEHLVAGLRGQCCLGERAPRLMSRVR